MPARENRVPAHGRQKKTGPVASGSWNAEEYSGEALGRHGPYEEHRFCF
jgi:hypothetical protein